MEIRQDEYTYMDELLLLSLQQVLNGDTRCSSHDVCNILARNTVSEDELARRRVLARVGRDLGLEGRDPIVPQARGGLKLSVSLGDLQVDLCLLEFLTTAAKK